MTFTGFARLVAETTDETGTKITSEGPVLFSGRTLPIEVTPATFNRTSQLAIFYQLFS